MELEKYAIGFLQVIRNIDYLLSAIQTDSDRLYVLHLRALKGKKERKKVRPPRNKILSLFFSFHFCPQI